MEIQIQLPSKGIEATYHVEQADDISFNVRLREFSGPRPPSYIRLYKTDIGWSSAFEDQELVLTLGQSMDARLATSETAVPKDGGGDKGFN